MEQEKTIQSVINFSDLDTTISEPSTIDFKFKDKTISINKYIKLEDKSFIIYNALETSWNGEFFDPTILTSIFYLNLVLIYSNIHFEQKELENKIELYDKVFQCSLGDEILLHIPEEEINDLLSLMEDTIETATKARLSFSGSLSTILNALPEQLKAIKESLKDIDISKMGTIMKMATNTGFQPKE